MNKIVQQYFNSDIKNQIAKLYGINPNDLTVLRDNLNIIYSFKQDGKHYILRVTHSSIQKSEELFSEIDWLHYLEKGGVNVACPQPSVNGKLLEVIPADDTYFSVSKFNKAPGNKITQLNWTAPVFKEVGRLTGQLHKLTKDYIPSKDVVLRGDCIATDAQRVLAHQNNHEPFLINELNRLLAKVQQLPKTKSNYGLIHNDINRGNMFLYKGQVYLFDTADCAYSWFATDVALTLFYALQYHFSNPHGSLTAHIRYFMSNYWEGYVTENELSETDIKAIPAIMSLKAIFLFDHLQFVWDIKNLNHVQKNFYEQMFTFSHEMFDFINFELIKP
jgi:Ser/Thr protein kinase RdoA (MazF antagonist)